MAYNGRTGNYTGAYPAGYGYQTPYWPQVQQPMMVQQEPNTRTVEVESADSIRPNSPYLSNVFVLFAG